MLNRTKHSNISNIYLYILDLQEFIIVPSQSEPVRQPVGTIQNVPAEYKWSVIHTRILSDLYSKYKNKVGTHEIKNLKMMWQKIAVELQALGTHVTLHHYMNRWKIIERNYKKFVDNQNKTGK